MIKIIKQEYILPKLCTIITLSDVTIPLNSNITVSFSFVILWKIKMYNSHKKNLFYN